MSAAEPVHWSLGYFRARGYRVTIYCAQLHSRVVDLDKAIALLGADLKLPEGRQLLLDTWRCPTCRRSGDSLTIHPPHWSIAGRRLDE